MHRLPQFLLFPLFLLPVFTLSQTWSLDTLAAMPEPVTNNAVCEGFIGDTGYVYSFTGLDSSKLYSGIHLKSWRYNILTDIWESLPDVPDTLGKIAASASRIGDIIYLIGGYHVYADGNEKSSNLVHRFDIQTNTWLPNGSNIPVAIDDQVQGVWKDSLIYVVTGWSDDGNVPYVQIYDPALDQWQVGTLVPDNALYKAFGASGYIFEDTIYYFGGAAFGQNFPIQGQLRKGIIDAKDPTKIKWSSQILQNGLVGYRTGVVRVHDFVHWLGGSEVTYNYDGIAYNGSGGVSPAKLNLYFSPPKNVWSSNTKKGLPMDLRGIAEMSAETKIIAGGMGPGQMVSNQTLQLSYNNLVGNSIREDLGSRIQAAYTADLDTILLKTNNNPLVDADVVITDMTGQELSSQKTTDRGAVYMGDLPTGIYVLTIRARGYEYVLKVKKQ